MPYIDRETRAQLDAQFVRFAEDFKVPLKAGELNYQVTQLALEYLARKGRSYTTLNEIVGVLESAKLEFYRRAVAAYEDEKIEQNGDVYAGA